MVPRRSRRNHPRREGPASFSGIGDDLFQEVCRLAVRGATLRLPVAAERLGRRPGRRRHADDPRAGCPERRDKSGWRWGSTRSSTRLHVVAHQDIVRTQIQFAVVNDRVGPGRPVIHRGFERAFSYVELRPAGLSRPKPPGRPSVAVTGIGVAASTWPPDRSAIVFPFPRSMVGDFDLARQEIEADGRSIVLSVAAIEAVPNQDDTAMVIFELLGSQEVDFLDVKRVAFLQFQQRRRRCNWSCTTRGCRGRPAKEYWPPCWRCGCSPTGTCPCRPPHRSPRDR